MESHISIAKVVAWVATLICVGVSARCAATFAINSARMFFVFALLSLHWALLLPYYANTTQTELLPAFGGFLLVYIGRLLHREGIRQRTATEPTTVQDIDRLALWLLGLIATPSALSLALPKGPTLEFYIDHVEASIGTVLTLIGFVSVLVGIKELYGESRKHWILLGVLVLVPYSLLETYFLWRFWNLPPAASSGTVSYWLSEPAGAMSVGLLYAFAAAKLAFTGAFLYLVLAKSLSQEDRDLTFLGKFLKFVGA